MKKELNFKDILRICKNRKVKPNQKSEVQTVVVNGYQLKIKTVNGVEIVERSETSQNRKKRLYDMLNSAELTKYSQFDGENLEDFTKPKLFGRLIERIKEGRSIVLYGKAGTGKTTLAVCAAKKLFDDGYDFHIIRWDTFMGTLKTCFSNGESVEKHTKKVKEADYLFIDELAQSAKRDVKNFEAEMFLEIISSRYSSDKPTLVTMNLTPEEIKKPNMFGPAAVSRLCDINNSILVNFDKEKNWRI